MTTKTFNGKTLIQIGDLAVGQKFYCGVNGPVYTKLKSFYENPSWFYCVDADGKGMRFQWDQYVETVEGETN